MRIVASKRLASTRARLSSGYLHTSWQCMEIYHMLKGSSTLEVKVRGEDFRERKLASTSTEVTTSKPLTPSIDMFQNSIEYITGNIAGTLWST